VVNSDSEMFQCCVTVGVECHDVICFHFRFLRNEVQILFHNLCLREVLRIWRIQEEFIWEQLVVFS